MEQEAKEKNSDDYDSEEEKIIQLEQEANEKGKTGEKEKRIWGKLTSINTRMHESITLKEDQYSFGRNPDNEIHIPDGRLSGVHCII